MKSLRAARIDQLADSNEPAKNTTVFLVCLQVHSQVLTVYFSGVLTGPITGVDDTQEGDYDSGAGITERENRPDAEREGDGRDADTRV